MLGNDVIDLRDPDTWPGACHPRFDHRVFTPGERAVIAASPRPAVTRWVHWAAKESAYKAARRRQPTTVFAPRRFAVVLAGGSGTVRHGTERFRLRIRVASDLVHVIAWEMQRDWHARRRGGSRRRRRHARCAPGGRTGARGRDDRRRPRRRGHATGR